MDPLAEGLHLYPPRPDGDGWNNKLEGDCACTVYGARWATCKVFVYMWVSTGKHPVLFPYRDMGMFRVEDRIYDAIVLYDLQGRHLKQNYKPSAFHEQMQGTYENHYEKVSNKPDEPFPSLQIFMKDYHKWNSEMVSTIVLYLPALHLHISSM